MTFLLAAFSALLFFIIWAGLNADLALIWSKVVLRGLSFVFSRLTKRFAAASVRSDTTRFLNEKVSRKIVGQPFYRLDINWVEEASDARLMSDGKLIVRIRRERDQTRNVVNATKAALPLILFPYVRPFAGKQVPTAVDLHLLRTLVDALGQVARSMYHSEILQPRLLGDADMQELIRVMFEIGAGGFFEAVIIQELLYLSDQAKHKPPSPELEKELRRFVFFVHRIATRDPGELQPLIFAGDYIRVAFILASKVVTAAKGTHPYERRLRIDLIKGAESVYLHGLTRDQFAVCRQIATKFDREERVKRVKKLSVAVTRGGRTQHLPLYLFRRRALYSTEETFAEQLEAIGLTEGQRVIGRVVSFAENRATVSIEGLEGEVAASELKWGFAGYPAMYLEANKDYQFVVLAVDDEDCLIGLGRKQLDGDSPWEQGVVPAVGTTCQVCIEDLVNDSLVVRFTNLPDESTPVYAQLPLDEWSWTKAAPTGEELKDMSQTELTVMVASVDSNTDSIVVSPRMVEARDWDGAVKKYPVGAQVRVRVTKVDYHGLRCELEPGVYGWIYRDNVAKAGFELADFQSSVVPGQAFDAVVIRLRNERRYFQLDLRRNVE